MAWKLYWKGMNDALEAAEQQMELEAQEPIGLTAPKRMTARRGIPTI